MPKTKPPISYTSRDFNSIRNDLINYVKVYYPDTYKDFNEALCDGWSKEQINRMVQDNIYEGIAGKTRINFKLMRKQ